MTAPLLRDRTALITGAGRGIGLAVAQAMAEHGARVILADLAPDAAATGIAGARAVALDVTDEAATEAAFDRLAAEGWLPDIVVPNAGILHLEGVETLPADRFRAVVDVNLTGAFLTARAAARRMVADGRIIFTASLFGLRGGAQNAAYSASKFGMVGLMESMAADLAPRGILVNCVAPGQIETDMMTKLVQDRLAMGLPDPRERLRARIPLGRLGSAAELAGTYVWLASPLATYVTGQTITVDGGWQVG
ncbi:SDR family NAD(P)-dependent oxidoreductase [Rubellimicrobium sp. CFH 75288]|uniref:SDR family NAD(P)-dependent oxidoreductase n=1 Tax=Rubellimicrobium sp. CFH 75288 TaxID=2697034 RepID=UPI0014134FE9|nr:SDR family NAD(P)-dependent oxidoreductase [Rubellimicrobium sp. CFH 75288]NAZ35304.1 SDR family oxidoreductase [Rubellimicrobium sp. CFH 75288]